MIQTKIKFSEKTLNIITRYIYIKYRSKNIYGYLINIATYKFHKLFIVCGYFGNYEYENFDVIVMF